MIEKKLENIGARASTNANEAAEGLGDAVASALGGWADRFRRSANVVSDQSAAIGKDAANLGGMALRRLSQEAERRPLYTVAVAVGIGVLIGLAARGWD